MIGKPRRFGALDEIFQAPKMLAIELLRGAEVHRNAMLDDFVLFEDLIEDVQRPSAIDHEIFRNNLEPVDDRFASQNVIVMWSAQADADTVVGEAIKAIC